MYKESIILEAGKPILRPLGIMQALFVAVFFCSPFAWIWKDWSLAWKVALTGIIGVLIIKFLYAVVKKAVAEVVEKAFEEEGLGKKPISRFQKRLNKLMEESKN